MTDLNKEREADTLPEVAHLLEQCKHRDLTLIERAFVKGARYAWQEKAKAQAVPTWISVKDEEPPTDTMVLICWSDSLDVQPEIDYMTCDEDLNHIWANFYNDPPTHWMHFHKVPSESGAEG